MPEEHSFYNLPEKCSLEDYRNSTENIVKKYSKADGLVSIYSWGNVSVAGISDIDILFVFKSNPNPLLFPRRSFYFLDKKSRYLARHPFVFIDEESFKKIRYVYPDTNFQLLHGKNIRIEGISSEEKYYSAVALLNDLVVRHYPRDFAGQSAGNSINVRDTLLRLNSLKYSVSMLEFLTKRKNREWHFILDRVSELRKDWFDDKDYGELIELSKNALDVTIDFVEEFRKLLLEKKLVKIKANDILYSGIKNKTLFVRNWNRGKAINDKYSVLPIELAAQLVEYSNSDGLISSYIRKNLSKRPECFLNHSPTVKKRIDVLNSQAQLSLKLRHSDFAAYFDFGYRSSAGVNNWFLKMMDKLRF